MFERKIAAQDDAQTKGGRRTASRDSLFLSAIIKWVGQSDRDPGPLRVRNLSAIGLMADYLDLATPGEPVIVTLRGIGAVAGKIAWVKRGRIGITFDAEVDPMKARKPVLKQPAPSRQRPL